MRPARRSVSTLSAWIVSFLAPRCLFSRVEGMEAWAGFVERIPVVGAPGSRRLTTFKMLKLCPGRCLGPSLAKDPPLPRAPGRPGPRRHAGGGPLLRREPRGVLARRERAAREAEPHAAAGAVAPRGRARGGVRGAAAALRGPREGAHGAAAPPGACAGPGRRHSRSQPVAYLRWGRRPVATLRSADIALNLMYSGEHRAELDVNSSGFSGGPNWVRCGPGFARVRPKLDHLSGYGRFSPTVPGFCPISMTSAVFSPKSTEFRRIRPISAGWGPISAETGLDAPDVSAANLGSVRLGLLWALPPGGQINSSRLWV